MSKVVHFEIPVDDAARAEAFYAGVFGWAIQGWGEQPYWLVTAGPEDEPGADGALIERGDIHTSPVVVVGVESVDDVLTAATAAGGEILLGKQEVPGVGWSAYLRDTEGNTIGIFEPVAGA